MSGLSALFQCGALLIIPIATFGLGIWKIMKIDEKFHRMSSAGLIGLITIEASIIGMVIDPRSANMSFQELFFTAVIIGVVSFLFVLLFLPLGIAILRIFKQP